MAALQKGVSMDKLEKIVVSLAGIAVIGLGGQRLEAIQSHAASRCQPIEQVLECGQRQLEEYCAPACLVE